MISRTSILLLPMLSRAVERVPSIHGVSLGRFRERAAGARAVLLGEATHGTAEFYEMRARLTQELILEAGFTGVALEADWPDAARLDAYVRHRVPSRTAWESFARFPRWMWRNREMKAFLDWLRDHNERVEPELRVGVYGLDLYSLYTSIAEVLGYLDRVDPAMARLARDRYACLEPWVHSPESYGWAAFTDRARSGEPEVTAMLRDLLRRRLEYVARDGEVFFDAARNARLVAAAEEYYRSVFEGAAVSWNLRDRHMFETLEALLNRRPGEKLVVWGHNSHVGDAVATEFSERGEISVGNLCRRRYGAQAYLVGFGTYQGTVAAAREWDGPMEVMQVRPAERKSYEWVFHQGRIPAFLLPLRGADRELREVLEITRLERAIGVVYRPETELLSHYFDAVLPRQFDEYVWVDETRAITPLGSDE